MDIRDISSLRREAGENLQAAAFSPWKLALLHSGVIVAVTLVQALVALLLQSGINASAGLSGLENRAMLSTIQTLTQYAVTLALPFWEFGLVFVVLALSRRQGASPRDLTLGFRNFGPVLRYQLLTALMYLGLVMVISYPIMSILLLTPLASPLMDAVGGLLESGVTDPEQIAAAIPQMGTELLPVALAMVLAMLAVLAPIFYRLRMGRLSLADDPRAGAMAAVRRSFRITRRNCLALLRLDLHFWWYYLALGLAAALCFGDRILFLAGVTLPLSPEVQYLLFYALGLGAQLLIHCLALPQVQLTYAAAYKALLGSEIPPKKEIFPAARWDY